MGHENPGVYNNFAVSGALATWKLVGFSISLGTERERMERRPERDIWILSFILIFVRIPVLSGCLSFLFHFFHVPFAQGPFIGWSARNQAMVAQVNTKPQELLWLQKKDHCSPSKAAVAWPQRSRWSPSGSGCCCGHGCYIVFLLFFLVLELLLLLLLLLLFQFCMGHPWTSLDHIW